MRIVIVGGSTGLGRSLGIRFAQRGDQVALLARRKVLLDDAVEEAGNGAFAVRCDVTDERSCRDAIEEAARHLGGIDAVVYSTGVGHLRRIEEVDAAMWQQTFQTNAYEPAAPVASFLLYNR
jgi:NAD(P)-dependent dehydrogenase (short-subunit alcohol dehydrogenase family)